ncbi:MAG: flippase-like domain-containing protein [Sphingobacterium sp.]|nr:flippase-like domain-containing protein [Sphingobacterium sp.]
MKKILSVILQYVIFLGLGIFLIWWTTRSLTPQEINQLKETLRGAHYLLVIPAMVMLMLSHYSRALRWKILMEPLQIRPTTANTFSPSCWSYFFNLLVPRLGSDEMPHPGPV